ncbi:hypothetical protein ACWDPV_24145, partial [Gordonia sp. NPDC003504]
RFSLRKPNLKQDNGVAPSRHAEPTHNYVTRAKISRSKEFLDLVAIEGGRLVTRYRSATISSVRASVSEASIIEAMVSLMEKLAPYVNKSTRRSRNYEYRILRAVMRARMLRGLIHKRHLESIYAGVEDLYSGEAAFWEQRSIAAQLNALYIPATSFAAKAVDLAPKEIHRRTTLGRLLILRSYMDVEPGSPESWDLYSQGKDQLIYAESLSPRRGIVLLNRFRQTLLLYRELVKNGALEDDYLALEEDLSTVNQECMDDVSLRHTEEQNVVHEMHGLFLQLKILRNGEFSDKDMELVLRKQLPPISENESVDEIPRAVYN